MAAGVIDELRVAWQEAQAELAALSAEASEDQRPLVSSMMQQLGKLEELAECLRDGPAVIMGAYMVAEDKGSPLSGKRVLVADDDDRVRAGVSQVLERLGCVVAMAQDTDC